MKGIKLLKPQPSPKSGREPLSNISNCFFSRPKSEKQSYRSPSHSPRNTNRSSYFDNERRKAPLSKNPVEAKLPPHHLKCLNHKQRTARFKTDGQTQVSHYCQHCAFELNQKGTRIVVIKTEDAGNKMVGEAKEFLKACDEALVMLGGKRNSLGLEKTRVQNKFQKLKQEIEQERKEIIKKVNEQYDKECREQEQNRRKWVSKIQEDLFFYRTLQKELHTVKTDVNDNIAEINRNIDLGQFREIMDFYWNKIGKFNEAVLKTNPQGISQSSQVFIAKYLPPATKGMNKTFEQAIRGGQPSSGKEFTFNKNLWGLQSRARQACSWQQSNPGTQSRQSVVEQKFNLQ